MAESYERLNAAMEERRVQLRMSWRDVTRAANMSYEGLRAIRKGERRPNSVTKARLEEALQWEPGSVDAVLDGNEPSTRSQESGQPANPDLRSELIELRQQLVNILDRIDEIQGRQ